MSTFLLFCAMVAWVPVAAAQSQPLPYDDVTPGAWYEEAAEVFLASGYLDASQQSLRPNATATRAEFLKLVVEMKGGILSDHRDDRSFDDVLKNAWYHGYLEEAAKESWLHGDHDCYGSHPCMARPDATISRAEAATIVARVFSFDASGGFSPQFVDNPGGQWFTEPIQALADHCVLQGDDATGRVRPHDSINRAEMITLLHRLRTVVSGEDYCSLQPSHVR